MNMEQADRVFRQEMRKIRRLKRKLKREREAAKAAARKGAHAKPRKRAQAAKTRLTSATVRDLHAMDRAFREAVTE